MANRSSFTSVLPRDIKRIINCTKGSDKYISDLKDLFIEAHGHHKKWHAEMLIKKSNVDMAGEEPADVVGQVTNVSAS